MSLNRRITWLNYPHLVIAKSCDGVSLFNDEKDYEFYIEQLRQMTKDRLLKIYAFCLTPQEIRLVIRPSRLLLSRIIQKLHTKFSKYVNKKLNRSGPLFRSRFSSLIFLPKDLPNVVRSVHLWPVRVGLVKRAEFYFFSTQASFLGMGSHQWSFVSSKEVLASFGNEEEAQKRAFSKFVEQAVLDGDNFGLSKSYFGIGGDDEVISELTKKSNINNILKKISIDFVAQKTSLLLGVGIEQVKSTSRRQDLVMARRLLATACVFGTGMSVSEVANYLQKDKAQVSRLVSQGMDLLNNNQPFLDIFEALSIEQKIGVI